MQVFLSIVINLIILAVVLPLFYIFIISKARERLEREAVKKVEDELSALVHEFNRSAISNVSLLEDAILRVRREYFDIVNNNKEIFKNDKKTEKDKIEFEIEATKKEIELNNFDKIERDTKIINKTLKFVEPSIKTTKEMKHSINIVVDDNIDNNTNEKTDSGSMNKAEIETALKKIKQNISLHQEKKVRTDNTEIEIVNSSNKAILRNNNDEKNTIPNTDTNTTIVELYKKGYTMENISIETGKSISEIELVLDMEIRDN